MADEPPRRTRHSSPPPGLDRSCWRRAAAWPRAGLERAEQLEVDDFRQTLGRIGSRKCPVSLVNVEEPQLSCHWLKPPDDKRPRRELTPLCKRADDLDDYSKKSADVRFTRWVGS